MMFKKISWSQYFCSVVCIDLYKETNGFYLKINFFYCQNYTITMKSNYGMV